jgi:hypothetical protein
LRDAHNGLAQVGISGDLAWLITTTVLTGDEIWYTVVALCVPGIDRLGLALAAAASDAAVDAVADADTGLAALPE